MNRTDDLSPTSRSALITGGSGGIGLAIAAMLAEGGYRLTIVGRDRARLDAAAATLRTASVRTLVGDVRDPETIEAIVATHVESYGGMDILVNSAGLLGSGALRTYHPHTIREVIEVDLTATILVTRAALALLEDAGRRHGQALIANIASISGQRADAGFSVYCAAKFGVVGFTAALAGELGAGVGACAVCPGVVDTPMGAWAKEWMPASAMLQPADIASAIRDRLLHRPAAEVPAALSL